jgi:hypothetical protein
MEIAMIVWKDLLKPRYALVVQLNKMPIPDDGVKPAHWQFFPCVMDKPYKRPLSVPLNQFYNGLNGPSVMVICGHKHTLKALYGIGSCEPHNIDNPNIFKPKQSA